MKNFSVNAKLDKAVSFLRKKEINLAENQLTEVLERFPKNPRALQLMKSVHETITASLFQDLAKLHKEKQYDQLLAKLLKLSNRYAHSDRLQIFIGVVYRDLCKYQNSIRVFEKIISSGQETPQVFNELALSYKSIGKLAEAKDCFIKALDSAPEYAVALNNLGTIHDIQGEPELAFSCYAKAILINDNYDDAYTNLSQVLPNLEFTIPTPETYDLLLKVIRKRNLMRPQELALPILSLLKNHSTVRDAFSAKIDQTLNTRFLDITGSLSSCNLLTEFMTKTAFADLDFENLFSSLRMFALKNADSLRVTSESENFLCSLAIQSFLTGFVYLSSDWKTKSFSKLRQEVFNDAVKGKDIHGSDLLILACYQPLGELNLEKLNIEKVLPEPAHRMLIENPKTEYNLRKLIPSWGRIHTETSKAVRDQYEVYPYPVWVELFKASKKVSLIEMGSDNALNFDKSAPIDFSCPKVLVAGCGTGQQAIELAHRLDGADILAVDLSLNSLSYAKRKANEEEISNITFVHGDLSNLEKYTEAYDYVECVGVLHHLSNPQNGLRILTQCLKPGGLFRLGLYSKLAREPVRKAQERYPEFKNANSNDKLRELRRKLIECRDVEVRKLLRSDDFYNLAMFKDLVCHVCEHSFSIDDIETIIDKTGLYFCGFENQKILDRFFKFHGSDKDNASLRKWDSFEKAHPETFAGMYQFWCQRLPYLQTANMSTNQ